MFRMQDIEVKKTKGTSGKQRKYLKDPKGLRTKCQQLGWWNWRSTERGKTEEVKVAGGSRSEHGKSSWHYGKVVRHPSNTYCVWTVYSAKHKPNEQTNKQH
jgi:hypothetical protein